MAYLLLQSNALHLPLADECVDAVVTDPPAGIEFMGKEWDSFKDRKRSRGWACGNTHGNDGFGGFATTLRPAFCSQTKEDRDNFIAFMIEVAQEMLRVLKPGGHALVWALPRTSHWTAMALEDAGFEVRDCISHVFGTGFPKSLNVSKAIDRAAGAEREVVGSRISAYGDPGTSETGDARNVWCKPSTREVPLTGAPATPEAQQWAGWGTALKPAQEMWWLVRKPLSEANVAANVLRHGTGAVNIDGCRIASGPDHAAKCASVVGIESNRNGNCYSEWSGERTDSFHPSGRWPANFILSCACDGEHEEGCAVRVLDEQSGERPGMGKRRILQRGATTGNGMGFHGADPQAREAGYEDVGGASRFFFCAKPSKREKEAGLDGSNPHPTVKSVALMSYLIRLITPPGGVVLDPFAGSGTTGVAARLEGMHFIGIEQDAEYARVARARIAHEQKPRLPKKARPEVEQLKLPGT